MTSEPVAVPANRNDRLHHRLLLILSAAVLLLAAGLQVDVAGQVREPFFGLPLPATCWYRRITGFACPGCGLTRCFIALMHGEVARAWAFNAGGIFFFLVVVGQIPYRVWQLWRIRRGHAEFRSPTLTTVACGLLLIPLFVQWLFQMWR